jgi:hypothetical protein
MKDRAPIVEQVVGAWRPRDLDNNLRPHPAWHDLDASGREEAYRETVTARQLEAALDREGLSTTARAVLAVIVRRR